MMRKMVIISGAIMLACLTYAVIWYQAAETMLEEARSLAKAEGIGYQFSRYTGFPGAITVTFGNLQWVGANSAQIEAPLLQMSTRPWNWQEWAVQLPHYIKYKRPGQPDHILHLKDPQGSLSIEDQGNISALHMTVDEARLVSGPEETSLLFADDLYLDLIAGDPGLGVGFNAEEQLLRLSIFSLSQFDALLPLNWSLPANAEVGPFTIQARLHGPMPHGFAEDMLQKWQAQGGYIGLEQVDLTVLDQDYALTGDVGLDEELRPRLKSELKIEDLRATGDQLSELSDLPEEFTDIFETIIRLLAIQDQAGSQSHVFLPLTIEEGALFVGPLRFNEVRPITQWGQPIEAKEPDIPSQTGDGPSDESASPTPSESNIPDIEIQLDEPPTVNLEKWLDE